MRNQAGNQLRQTRWRPLTSKRRCHAIFDKRKSPNTPFGTGEGLALAHLYNLCRWRRKCRSSSFPQAEGGTSLKLLDPDSDQVARDVVAFGETVECLARNEVLGDLSFELDAMGAVLGHGFHPLKARQRRSIPNLQTVHRQGRIPHIVAF